MHRRCGVARRRGVGGWVGGDRVRWGVSGVSGGLPDNSGDTRVPLARSGWPADMTSVASCRLAHSAPIKAPPHSRAHKPLRVP